MATRYTTTRRTETLTTRSQDPAPAPQPGPVTPPRICFVLAVDELGLTDQTHTLCDGILPVPLARQFVALVEHYKAGAKA